MGRLKVEAVGEALESVGDGTQGGDGFAADFGDDGGVDVCGGVADFHLDEFDGLFNALGNAAGRRIVGRRRRIAAHREYLSGASAEGPFSV